MIHGMKVMTSIYVNMLIDMLRRFLRSCFSLGDFCRLYCSEMLDSFVGDLTLAWRAECLRHPVTAAVMTGSLVLPASSVAKDPREVWSRIGRRLWCLPVVALLLNSSKICSIS